MTSQGEVPDDDTARELLDRLEAELPWALPSALRRSPGRLASGDFTHAVSLPGGTKSPLEVHAGVAVIGKSKVAHEADVLVLPEGIASRCRMLGIDPRSHQAILVVEGKYFSSPLSLGMRRQFLGLDVDVSADYTIMAATVVSQSVSHLLQGRKQHYEFGVPPGRKAEHDLKERFAIALRGYRNRR